MEVTTVFIFSSLILILVIGLKLIIFSYLKSSERLVHITYLVDSGHIIQTPSPKKIPVPESLKVKSKIGT